MLPFWEDQCSKPLVRSNFEVYGCAAKRIFLVQGREHKLLMYSLFLELMYDFFLLLYAFEGLG